ncbi:MAG: alkaline phosphatase family protein [Candidatus Brockarchaeota archaeon]|nr:alkaline phosphatase family protein [Candidatus Brockarchaeota archaeon]
MKVVVLGFDGASPDLVDEWIDHLPALGRFKDRGVLGRTVPPVPAQTPVAWATFMTGKNPGKHGVFSFIARRSGTYERDVAEPKKLKSKTIWKIVREAGKKAVTINVPMTDAEEGVTSVPGFLSSLEGVPQPKSLGEKVARKFGIDRVRGDLGTETLDRVDTDPDLFFEEVNEITEEMAEISLCLLQEESWDLFMPVFMGLDRIQHFFWKCVDPNHPRHEESEYGELVRKFYVKIDEIAGEFLKSAGEDALTMVVSDHGFCPVHTEVVVNDYLAEEGFLEARDGEIDLEGSMAVSYGYGDVWLNVKGREPRGVVSAGEEYEKTRDGIMECLGKIEVGGKRPIKAAKRREELWWGPYLNEAPDLTAIFNVGYQAARRPLITNGPRRYVNLNPRWSGGHDGTHDPGDVPGILGIVGPGIPKGKRVEARLWDLAPTILDLMGIPIPADIDGKPLALKDPG